MDDGAGPSTVLTQLLGPTPQATTLTPQPLQIIPGVYPSPYMYPNSYMFLFPSPMPGGITRDTVRGAHLIFNPHRLMGFKHLRRG
ncbi:hypothetical protein Goklo_020998 [Gossypium klotzschianum]|uniref:Uncharacterized protein n=1 Tax=Gossypium klotzschianum TaxID=34286 RepID=A0A7J8UTQ0_9ROSI|nr:hypothetical protein [Gossypium klotzschianum]